MSTPTPIAFLYEFLNWSATDGRVGEVRHSDLIDKATAAINSFNSASGPSLPSLKATFESAAQALWDARAQFGGLVLNDSDLKKITVLEAVTERAEAEYMIALYQVQYSKASARWGEALRNLA
jgi:hypothetical protein